MNTHADKTQENKSQSVSAADSQMQSGGESAFQFADNRPEAIAQRKLQEIADNHSKSTFQLVDNRPEAIAQRKLQEMANNSPQVKQATQLQAMADNHSAQQKQPIQKKENNTGLPDNLKTGMEKLSGYSMDDVKVHRNSDRPAQLQAYAYAQGTDIHLGPRQEKHLPHEAWHVVQQKQGRVKPTMQMKGKVNVNDDAVLEKEADMMGAKSVQIMSNKEIKNHSTSERISEAPQRKKLDASSSFNSNSYQPIQRQINVNAESMLGPRNGRIKVSNLIRDINNYNANLNTESYEALLNALQAIVEKLYRYYKKMTTTEVDVQGDSLTEILSKVGVEIKHMKPLKNIVQTPVGNVASKIEDGVNRVTAGLTYRSVNNGRTDARIHTLDHSLKRHHYNYLEGDPKDKNSIIYAAVNDGNVINDGKDVGEQVQTHLDDLIKANTNVVTTAAADGQTFTVNGRDFKTEGTEGIVTPIPNHFFAVKGNNVWRDVSAADYTRVKLFKGIVNADGPLDGIVPSLLTGHGDSEACGNFRADLSNMDNTLINRFFTISAINPAKDGFRDAILFAKQPQVEQNNFRFNTSFARLKANPGAANDVSVTRASNSAYANIRTSLLAPETGMYHMAKANRSVGDIKQSIITTLGNAAPNDAVLGDKITEMFEFVAQH